MPTIIAILKCLVLRELFEKLLETNRAYRKISILGRLIKHVTLVPENSF